MASITATRNYALFELHLFNRDVEKINRLKESMRKHGWIDAYPMHCVREGNGRLRIKAGHHRFTVARELGIPVKYVVCDDDATIYELEQATNKWDLPDYLVSHCRTGKADYCEVARYIKETGIGVANAASMFYGEMAGSHNVQDAFKRGDFNIRDRQHPLVVAQIVRAFREAGVAWAINQQFIQAISRIAKCPQFVLARALQKIAAHGSLCQKQPNLERYMQMFEDIYNRQAKDRVPLVFFADEAAKARNKAHRVVRVAAETVAEMASDSLLNG